MCLLAVWTSMMASDSLAGEIQIKERYVEITVRLFRQVRELYHASNAFEHNSDNAFVSVIAFIVCDVNRSGILFFRCFQDVITPLYRLKQCVQIEQTTPFFF